MSELSRITEQSALHAGDAACPETVVCVRCVASCSRRGLGCMQVAPLHALKSAVCFHQVSGNHRLDDSKAERERVVAAGAEVAQSEVQSP